MHGLQRSSYGELVSLNMIIGAGYWTRLYNIAYNTRQNICNQYWKAAPTSAIDDRKAAGIEYIEDSQNVVKLAFLLACSPKIFWSWRLYYASWDLCNTVSIPWTRLKAFSLLGSDCSLRLFLLFLTFWGSYPFDLAHINRAISTSCSAHSYCSALNLLPYSPGLWLELANIKAVCGTLKRIPIPIISSE